MLDLSTAFGKELYEIRLFDGTVLHLQRPTQSIQQCLLDAQEVIDNNNEKQAMAIMTNIFCRVLNRNQDGLVFDAESLSNEYDLTLMSYVLQDYFLYWNKEVNEVVDFPATQQ